MNVEKPHAPLRKGKRRSLLLTFLLLLPTLSFANTLRIAAPFSENTSWMPVLREGAEVIETKTNARVKIKFFPSGVMGTNEAVLRKIQLGQLHGAVLPTGALHLVAPNLRLYNIPALFHSFHEVDSVRKSIDPVLFSELEQQGYVSMGFAEGGFAYLMSKNRVASLLDLRLRNLWIPDDNLYLAEVAKSYGIAPIMLDIDEVLTALQTNIIDTIAVSPIVAYAMGWHTEISQMLDFPLLYFMGTLVIHEHALQELEEVDQGVVKTVLRTKVAEIDADNRRNNLLAYQRLQRQGVKLHKTQPEEAEVIRVKAAQLRKPLLDNLLIDLDLYVQMNEIITAQRQ